MKLSQMLQKAKISLDNILGKGKTLSPASKKENPSISTKSEDIAIVLKEKKKSVLIKCWNDGKELWVKKGSRCHVTGLCSKCLNNGVR